VLFDRVIALEPGNGEAWFYGGLAKKELGDTEAALASLEKAAEIDSARADRWFWLGVLHDARKRTADAERAFRRVIELEPNGTLAGKAHRQLGYYLLLRKQWKDAIHHLERGTNLDPDDAQAWLWLAQGHQNAGNRAKAAVGYRRVLKLDPNNAQAKRGLQSLSAVSRRG
jgi:tetratricopeptide (TPR) repeat protein